MVNKVSRAVMEADAFAHKNAIINGNFDVWQRGSSLSGVVNTDYMADRWRYARNGSGATLNVSRQPFTAGQTDVPGNPSYFMRLDQTVAGTGETFSNLEQRFENLNIFAGETVTISFYVKASASATLPEVSFFQYFGSGGSASVNSQFTTNVSVTTSWVRHEYTVSVPSTLGKTIGTGPATNILFKMPLNTTFTIDIAQIQVEKGPVATEFERRSIGEELTLCQRYYYKTFEYDTAPAQNAGLAGAVGAQGTSDGAWRVDLQYPVRMRVSPTLTTYNPSAANANVRNLTDGTDSVPNTTSSLNSARSASITRTATASDSNDILAFHLSADAEL